MTDSNLVSHSTPLETHPESRMPNFCEQAQKVFSDINECEFLKNIKYSEEIPLGIFEFECFKFFFECRYDEGLCN